MTTGSLQIKNNRYYAVICFNNNGKQTQKWISTKLSSEPGNKRKAQAFLKEKIEEYEYISSAADTRILFCDFLEDWVEIHKTKVELVSYAGYKRLLRQIVPYFKKLNVTLTELTPMHLHKYYTFKLKTVSPNTVVKYHVVIRMALEYARKMRMVRENVADLVEKPKQQKYIGSFYSQDEILKLIEVIKGKTIEVPTMFAIYFGLRRSEVVGIKWSAIDFANKSLTINHKIVPVNDNGTYILHASNTLKNNASYRSMPLDDSFYNYLVELKAKQKENKRLFGASYNNEYAEYVCVNDLGNLITPNYISKTFKRILEKNNMRHIRFHDLRHSSASLLLSLGYPMKNIQMWLGHSSFNTTANIYAHIDASSKVDMMASISHVLN